MDAIAWVQCSEFPGLLFSSVRHSLLDVDSHGVDLFVSITTLFTNPLVAALMSLCHPT
jgi:hypothetical protein